MVQSGRQRGSRSVAGRLADSHLRCWSTAVRDRDPQLHQFPDAGPTHRHSLRNVIGGESPCPNPNPNPNTDSNFATDHWVLSGRSDGGIFNFGNSVFYGSEGGTHLNAPIVGTASTPNGGGYWLVASDGGVFSFGNADYYGSEGGTRSTSPSSASPPPRPARATGSWRRTAGSSPSAMRSTTAQRARPRSTSRSSASPPLLMAAATGSWRRTAGSSPSVMRSSTAQRARPRSTSPSSASRPLLMVAATGSWRRTAGSSPLAMRSSTARGRTTLNKPIVGIAATPDGGGYWLVASDGGIFSFGDATFYGSEGGTPLNKPIVGIG